MNKDKLVTYSFLLSFIITILGALIKVMHWPNGNLIITIGLLFLVIFVFTSIYEITNSEKIKNHEKIIWVVGFIFFSTITGLIYILSARKRIINNNQNQTINKL